MSWVVDPLAQLPDRHVGPVRVDGVGLVDLVEVTDLRHAVGRKPDLSDQRGEADGSDVTVKPILRIAGAAAGSRAYGPSERTGADGGR
jgi:hypothetical protein